MQKSVAEVDGVFVEFWYSTMQALDAETFEVYLQAEALHLTATEQEVLDLISPYMSGENTYKIETVEDEDGNLASVETGEDTRSFMKKWYDSYYA